MVAGSAAVCVCYLILGWTQEIVGYFVEDEVLVWYWSMFLGCGFGELIFDVREGSMPLCWLCWIYMCLILLSTLVWDSDVRHRHARLADSV